MQRIIDFIYNLWVNSTTIHEPSEEKMYKSKKRMRHSDEGSSSSTQPSSCTDAGDADTSRESSYQYIASSTELARGKAAVKHQASVDTALGHRGHRQGSGMHAAIRAGNIKLVLTLIKKGDIVCCAQKKCCVGLARKHGSKTFLKQILELQPEGVSYVDYKGSHILNHFIKDPEMFVWIVKQIAENHKIPGEIICEFLCKDMDNKEYINELATHLKSISYKIHINSLLKFISSLNFLTTLKLCLREQILDLEASELVKLLAKMLGCYCYANDSKTRIDLERDVIKMFVESGFKLQSRDGSLLLFNAARAPTIKYLLELRTEIADEHRDEFLYKLVAKTKSSMICEILDILHKQGTVISAGQKSLFESTESVRVAKKLLRLHCKDPVPPRILFQLVYSFYEVPIQELDSIINSLIAKGADMLALDEDGCNLICYAFNASTLHPGNIGYCKYLMCHPAFETDDFILTCKNLSMLWHWPSDALLPLIFSSKKFHSLCYFQSIEVSVRNYFHFCKVGAITAFIAQRLIPTYKLCFDLEGRRVMRMSGLKNVFDPHKQIEVYIKSGWNVKEETDKVSILSVWLYHFPSPDGNRITKYLIAKGVNVESSNLVFKNQKLHSLQKQLFVPDAFLVAAMTGNMDFIRDYSAHLACPVMCLALFPVADSCNYMSLLNESRRMPHGTALFKALSSKMERLNNNLARSFNEMHNSPLTLLELSRQAVRMSLAPKAVCDVDKSLPDMFESILPGVLSDQLIKYKIDRMIYEEREQAK